MKQDLSRFITAQHFTYEQVLLELKQGCKRSHWMWFIFPQFCGLGYSDRTRFYAIKSVEEARAYVQDSLLGERLVECAGLLLEIEGKTVRDIFESPDDLKLQSSMTLFTSVSELEIFDKVLERYFEGKKDQRTLELMGGGV